MCQIHPLLAAFAKKATELIAAGADLGWLWVRPAILHGSSLWANLPRVKVEAREAVICSPGRARFPDGRGWLGTAGAAR